MCRKNRKLAVAFLPKLEEMPITVLTINVALLGLIVDLSFSSSAPKHLAVALIFLCLHKLASIRLNALRLWHVLLTLGLPF